MIKLFTQAKIGWGKIFLLLLFITLQVAGTLYLPRLTASIIDNGVVAGNRDYVFRTGALMLGVAVFTGVFSILGTFFSAEVATSFSRNIRQRLFKKTQDLSYQDFRHFNTSSLITRATNDIEQLQGTLSMLFEMLIPAPFVVVIGIILSFRSDTYLGMIVLIASSVFLIVFIPLAVIVLPMFAKVQAGLDKINERVMQYISGIRVIHAFNRTGLETESMNGSFQNQARLNIKINRLFAVMMPTIYLIMGIVMVGIIWFGGVRIDSGDMQLGAMTAVMEYSMNILMYLIMAVFVTIFIPRAKVCAARIREVLDYRAEIKDGKQHIDPASPLRLEFRNVNFRYQDAENPVLHNINFTCEQGTTTAIIGGTGSGKSTVARLIPRLIDATEGEILLNGVNIKDLPQEEERRMVGFVPQKSFLFSGTIADNLRHGNKNATQEELEEAAMAAQAHGFIDEMENKYESTVEQGGRNFSGGQRQRLSIARMLVKKPDVYVFDDSFSALDFKTDAALRKALKAVTQNAIVVTIAQRISSIKDSNQIIVMDEGKIASIGTHEQLLAICPVYLEIAKSQLSEEELGL